MNVMLAGLTGAGKTTLALQLADLFQLRYISGSAIRAKYVVSSEMQSEDFWRLSPLAKDLDTNRMRDPQSDLAADAEMCALARAESDLIFDVWSLPWICAAPAVRIWLECSADVRIRRLIDADTVKSINADEWIQRVADKDRRAREFFLRHYTFDLFADRTPFDAIVNTGYIGSRSDNSLLLEVLSRVITLRSFESSTETSHQMASELADIPPGVLLFHSDWRSENFPPPTFPPLSKHASE